MRIAIDIDSTLHHYWPELERALRETFGVGVSYEEQAGWAIDGLTAAQVRECVELTHADERILKCSPYPGAVQIVTSWRRRGHYVQISSHRSRDAFRATKTWLRRIGLEHNELHVSRDKVAHAVATGVDLLIDDSPRVLRQALGEGIACAAIIHPWNRDLIASGDVVGAATWQELAQRLEPVLGASSEGRGLRAR